MCHVLIIEDEALIALDVQGVLADCGGSSFAFAATEEEAIHEARLQRPEFIASDVKLAQGTGPRAVETIQREIGAVPVVFLTGTPEACIPCEPPARIFTKPVHEPSLAAAFRELAPL